VSYQKRRQAQYQIDVRRSQGIKGLAARKKGYPGINFAKEIFEGRSERSKGQDLVRLAQIAPSVTIWLRDPSRWDLPGIDTPNAQRIFEHRSTRQKAQDLARRARKTKNIELWAGNVNRYDFDNVDTPARGKHVRRFRVMEKEEDKKQELKKTETKKTEEKKHTLPSKQQIIERAQELHMQKEVKQGLPAISAEESELKESGEFEKARSELMRGEKSKADAQIESYVHDLNSELEGMGYRIVPID
jgi:hypothetical protein